MKTKHTPGPWTIRINSIHGADEVHIATAEWGGPRKGERPTHANVARIVSCVNALDGVEDPAAYIEAMRRELRRLVDLCDTEATMFDGSNPDTRAAHALLGDFNKPADEDGGGWRY